jgi:hypothetical protein
VNEVENSNAKSNIITRAESPTGGAPQVQESSLRDNITQDDVVEQYKLTRPPEEVETYDPPRPAIDPVLVEAARLSEKDVEIAQLRADLEAERLKALSASFHDPPAAFAHEFANGREPSSAAPMQEDTSANFQTTAPVEVEEQEVIVERPRARLQPDTLFGRDNNADDQPGMWAPQVDDIPLDIGASTWRLSPDERAQALSLRIQRQHTLATSAWASLSDKTHGGVPDFGSTFLDGPTSMDSGHSPLVSAFVAGLQGGYLPFPARTITGSTSSSAQSTHSMLWLAPSPLTSLKSTYTNEDAVWKVLDAEISDPSTFGGDSDDSAEEATGKAPTTDTIANPDSVLYNTQYGGPSSSFASSYDAGMGVGSATEEALDAQSGEEDTGRFSFLQWGGSPLVSLLVAEKYPRSTVVVLQQPQQRDDGKTNEGHWVPGRHALGLQNCLLGERHFTPEVVSTIAAVETTTSTSASASSLSDGNGKNTRVPIRPLVGIQFFPDLEEFLGPLLPHEFEHLLGSVLCFSERTFVPSDLPDHRFFSYWEDTTSLMLAAGQAVGVVVEVNEITPKQSSSSSSSYNNGYSNSYNNAYSRRSSGKVTLSVSWSHPTEPLESAPYGWSATLLSQMGIVEEDHLRLFGALLQMTTNSVASFREGGSMMTSGSFRFEAGKWTTTDVRLPKTSSDTASDANSNGSGSDNGKDGASDSPTIPTHTAPYPPHPQRPDTRQSWQPQEAAPVGGVGESTNSARGTIVSPPPEGGREALEGGGNVKNDGDGSDTSAGAYGATGATGAGATWGDAAGATWGDAAGDVTRPDDGDGGGAASVGGGGGGGATGDALGGDDAADLTAPSDPPTSADLDLESWMDKSKRDFKQQQQQQEAAAAVKPAKLRGYEALVVDKDAGAGGTGDNGDRNDDGYAAEGFGNGGRRQLLHFLRSEAVDRIKLAEAQYTLRHDTLVDDPDDEAVLNLNSYAYSEEARLSTWTEDTRHGQSLLVAQEEAAFAWFWARLVPELGQEDGEDSRNTASAAARFSMLTLGRQFALLDTKLSVAYPSAVVVSVKAHDEPLARHLELTDLMQVRNNVICRSIVAPATLAVLAAKRDPFRYQVVGSDFFWRLVDGDIRSLECNPMWFEKQLGGLLANAGTTFLEVPPWSVLQAAVDLLGARCAAKTGIDWFASRYTPPSDDDDGNRADYADPRAPVASMSHPEMSPYLQLLSHSISAVAAEVQELESAVPSVRLLLVPAPTADSAAGTPSAGSAGDNDGERSTFLIRVDLEKWARLETTPSGTDGDPWQRHGDSWDASNGAEAESGRRHKDDGEGGTWHAGISLFTLLQLQVIPSMTAELFRLYLELPMDELAFDAAGDDAAAVLPSSVRYFGADPGSGGDGSDSGSGGGVLIFVDPRTHKVYSTTGRASGSDSTHGPFGTGLSACLSRIITYKYKKSRQ